MHLGQNMTEMRTKVPVKMMRMSGFLKATVDLELSTCNDVL